jgi:hypothetical protein
MWDLTREESLLDRILRVAGSERCGVCRILVGEQELAALVLPQVRERLGELLVV